MKNYEANKARIEVYLHWLLCSYLDGNFEKAKEYLKTLRTINNENPQSFLFLSNLEIKRLKNIAYALDNNVSLKTYTITEEVKEKINSSPNLISEEKVLVKQIIRNEDKLKKVLEMPKLRIVSSEHPTEYGNVDLVAKTKSYVLPIEVKKNIASFSVVSQIDKYMKHYLKILHYKLWKDVIGVTIAGGYDKYALEELKHLGVKILQYEFVDNTLNLIRVG
jgi:RecB family endonuclease NucS